MKKTLTSLAVVLFGFPSCGQKKEKTGTPAAIKTSNSERKVLSLAELRTNQQNCLDREVTIATYLFTHGEGPWVGDNPKEPILNGLSLKVNEASELVAADSSEFRWWFEYQEGLPVILSGVFRVGDWSKHGRLVENHPYIEVASAKEVGTNDAIWRSNKTGGEPDPGK